MIRLNTLSRKEISSIYYLFRKHPELKKIDENGYVAIEDEVYDNFKRKKYSVKKGRPIKM